MQISRVRCKYKTHLRHWRTVTMMTAPTAADSIDTIASVSTQLSSPEVSEIKYNRSDLQTNCLPCAILEWFLTSTS